MSVYRHIAETADRAQASPWFLLGFNLAWSGLLAWSLDASNLTISVLTANSVFLAAATARATGRALHAKLDELLYAVRGAREDLAHVEDRDEAYIAELRR